MVAVAVGGGEVFVGGGEVCEGVGCSAGADGCAQAASSRTKNTNSESAIISVNHELRWSALEPMLNRLALLANMKEETMKRSYWVIAIFVILALTLTSAAPLQADNPNPPDHVVKLIFIHHSTGENWLRDDYGGLGLAFSQNNYFVSDTNYGWGPDSIGDRTDIPNWTEWFRSVSTPTYMQAVFDENGQNSSYTRTVDDPGGENEIIMFKSCFPNSDLYGNPDDPPGTYEEMTVSGAKYVYNQILQYFAARPDKLFVVITAPPLSDPTNAANARAFKALMDQKGWDVADIVMEQQTAIVP